MVNWLFLIQRKSSILEVFVEFKEKIEKQIDRNIKSIQTDNEVNSSHLEVF